MMKTMFCPKCGAGEQSAESYCKRCGEWLPDLDDTGRPRLFRKRSREEKLRKMRLLEAVSAGLSLTAAAIIISILAGGETELLFLAAFCCILVAVYQGVNFYLGYKLQHRVEQSRAESADEMRAVSGKGSPELSSGEATPFVGAQSVVEHTTELLEPLPRRVKRDE